MMVDELEYYFLSFNELSIRAFSLKIGSADFYAHENILNSLIGNLVKYMPSGKLEPYLAKSFSVSDDQKTWIYELREGLTCDDDSHITAQKFVENLTNQIYEYSKSSPPIDFEHLIGYHEFIKNKNIGIKGLKSDKNLIIFQFDVRPENLNEMLRMPYFGYWHQDTFNSKSIDGIADFISSGPYKISPKSSGKKIILEKRRNWFTYNDKSPDMIKFSYMSTHMLNEPFPKYYIFDIFGSNEELRSKLANSSVHIKASPDMFLYFSLSPTKNDFFKDRENRQAFLNQIRKEQKNLNYYSDNQFYFHNKTNIVESNVYFKFKSNEFVILNVASFNKNINKIKGFLEKVFKDYPIKFNFIPPQDNKADWYKDILDNTQFDSRIGSVMNGTQILNSIVKMMFCTNLGVNFPDPSGRICKLVKKYDGIEGPLSEEYISTFNQILYDDACVIPLDHFGREFFISKNINPNSFPVTADHPLFDYLELE